MAYNMPWHSHWLLQYHASLETDDKSVFLNARGCWLLPTGCNLAVDVTWKYLNFFMTDDKKLKHIESEYGSGRMLTGEAKAELIKVMLAS